MKAVASPYYPPRAGWTRYFHAMRDSVRAWVDRLRLNEYDKDGHYVPTHFFRDCLVPGFGFKTVAGSQAGRCVLIAWLTAFVVFFVWIGYPVSHAAFMVMITLHSTSILCLINYHWPGISRWRKILVSIGVVILVGSFTYSSVLRLCEAHLVMPVSIAGKRLVINRLPWAHKTTRGNFVAYTTSASTFAGVTTLSGIGVDKVLGGPGDVVVFTASDYRINGAAFPRLDHMPVSGTITVPADTWFIWPTLKVIGRVDILAPQVAQAVNSMALVPQSSIIGKPFRRWLWKTQIQVR